MTDLDPALVSRAASVMWEKLIRASPSPVAGMLVAHAETYPAEAKASFCGAMKAALLSLGIPAAALNALYRGEAVVVNETTGLPYIESDALKARE